MAGARSRAEASCSGLAALAALWASACEQKVVVLATDAPPEVSHVAILELDASSKAIVATSPLRPFRADQPLWLEASDGKELLVAGFERASLVHPTTGELPSALETDLVAFAEPCGPRLPDPRWIAHARDGALTPAEFPPPALTAPWIESHCAPPLDGPLDLDVRRCDRARCSIASRQVGPCRTEIETNGCEVGRLVLSWSRSSLRCAALEGTSWSCEPDQGGERTVLRCGPPEHRAACLVEPVPRSRDESPRYEEARVAFGGPRPTPAREPSTRLFRDVARWGPGKSFLPLADRVVVVAMDEENLGLCRWGQVARRLVFVDPERMSITGTVSAANCLDFIAPALSGGSFVGGIHDGQVPSLGLFDADGRLLRSVVLDSSRPGTTIQVDAVITAGSYYVVLMVDLTAEAWNGWLVFVDDALVVRGRYAAPGRQLGAPAAVPDAPNRLIVWHRYGHGDLTEVALISIPDGRIESSALEEAFGVGRAVTGLTIGDRVVITGDADKAAAIFTVPDLERRTTFGPIGAIGYVHALAPWPGGLLLAGGARFGADGETIEGEISFIDPAEERFLAGRKEIGWGPATEARADASGRVWLLLSWAGELVRLTPRP